jgi:hypothetical protein
MPRCDKFIMVSLQRHFSPAETLHVLTPEFEYIAGDGYSVPVKLIGLVTDLNGIGGKLDWQWSLPFGKRLKNRDAGKGLLFFVL